MIDESTIQIIQLIGALLFGTIIGWYVYLINRYRKGDVQLSDLAALIGVIGGSAVLALFDREGGLFGAYGIGLAIGFFSYFLSLIVMVSRSNNFNNDWFLDGRRKKPAEDYVIPPGTAETIRPMGVEGGNGGHGPND